MEMIRNNRIGIYDNIFCILFFENQRVDKTDHLSKLQILYISKNGFMCFLLQLYKQSVIYLLQLPQSQRQTEVSNYRPLLFN